MIYIPPPAADTPLEDWAAIFDELVAYSVDYDRAAPKPWLCYKTPLEAAQHAAGHYMRLETPYVKEVERCLRVLISKGSCKMPSKEVQYYLGFRIDVVIAFVSLIVTKDRFMPFSIRTNEEIILWLLIDWWKERGAIAAYTFGHIV